MAYDRKGVQKIGRYEYAVITCDVCGKKDYSLDRDTVMPFLPPGWKAVGVNGVHGKTCSGDCAVTWVESHLTAPTLQPTNPLPLPDVT